MREGAFEAIWPLLGRLATTGTDRELAFLLVNDSLSLAPYRQAAFWLAGAGVYCLSGVVQVEANTPYVQWLERIAQHLHTTPEAAEGPEAASPAGVAPPGPRLFNADDLPPALAADWSQWWPAHGLWLPGAGGGLALLREDPWSLPELQALASWMAAWSQAFTARHRPSATSARAWGQRISSLWRAPVGQVWWRQTRWRFALALVAMLLVPVRLTVLAPAELVAAKPAVVRAPLDGVIDQFHVQPNQAVRKGTLLFGFDEALIRSRLEIGRQALAAAEVDYRQTLQLALTDARAKGQLALLTGKIEERRAEVALAAEQMSRARVLAPEDGVVLMDDPSEWIGKPVTVGERILRIASTEDREIEAWLPVADAIALAPGAPVTLYLQASPLEPVSASLRYMAHDAQARSDGQFAYRLRATLDGPTQHRIGLKGTAKLQAGWVPLGYWMLRRPWAAARAAIGW